MYTLMNNFKHIQYVILLYLLVINTYPWLLHFKNNNNNNKLYSLGMCWYLHKAQPPFVILLCNINMLVTNYSYFTFPFSTNENSSKWSQSNTLCMLPSSTQIKKSYLHGAFIIQFQLRSRFSISSVVRENPELSLRPELTVV